MSSTNHSLKKQKFTKKKTAGGDLFEITQEQSWAHWRLHALAAVVCVIFAVWVWLLNPIPQIHPDQINIVTMTFSKAHPDNFARDPVWGNRAADHYPPLPRGIISSLIKKFGIIGGHRAAQLPLSIAYLFVMYGILYYLTRSVPAALLVALASIIWRWSLGETYWGLDRLQAVQPRSFALILITLLFIWFWKLRDSWWLLAVFFIAGLLFNINPPSSFSFAVLSWSSLFLVSLRNRDRILRLIAASVVLLLGALPFICANIAARSRGAVEMSPLAVHEYMNAMQYRFSHSLMHFPLSGAVLSKAFLFGFSVPVFLATIAWCLRREKRNMFDRWLVCFFLLSFVGTIIAQYIMQKVYWNLKIPQLFPNFLRGQKFAYLVLYIYTAWLLAELFRRFIVRDRCVLIVIIAMIVAVMPLFGNNPNNPWGQWDYNKSQMNALLGGENIEITGWHNRIANLCDWVRQKTPNDSLFLFVHRNMDPFRIYALRSIVSSHGSGDTARFSGPKLFLPWAKCQQELDLVIALKNVQRLLKLANRSKADYIIVSNDFPEVTGWTPVMRDRFWTVYKKP